MKNKVSIIIPVYNGENYIKEAIDSVLNQTYKNIEVIVVNDGSIDNTENICKSYGKKIKYYYKENGGVSTALNLGVKEMTGDYFSWLSHDDKYYPEKIEKQINYLKDKKLNNVILYSNYSLMNSNSKIYNHIKFDNELLNTKNIYALLRGAVNGITILIPKEAFDKCGLFDEELRCTQDYNLWFKMIAKYKFIHMEDDLAITRIHSNQTTNTSDRMLSEGNALWINMINSISNKEKKSLEGSLYNFYYEEGKFLLETPYTEAKDYCIAKCKELDNKKYQLNPIKKERKNIAYYFKYLKEKGLKYTLKKVFNKVKTKL